MSESVSNPAQQQTLTADQWAGESGKRWLSELTRLEKMIEPIGNALIERANYRPGERVVDIGCGGGWTTRQIAVAVGTGGVAVGLDISADLTSFAAKQAEETGLTNVRFEVGDAARAIPAEAPFDRLFSRFGCMFFPEPYPAFANLGRMVRKGGGLDIAVWAPARENQWNSEMMAVVKRHIDLPPPAPRAPGPYAMGEMDYVRDLLTQGGFGDVDIDVWSGLQYIGGPGSSPEQAKDFMLDATHIGNIVRAADETTISAVHAGLIDMFTNHMTPNGVALDAKALLISAVASGDR